MNRLIRRINRILNNPMMLIYYIFSKAVRQNMFHHYSKISNREGINELKFVISFDCDTIQDIQVVEGVNQRLNDLGIIPVYAVPGELLIKGSEIYRKVLSTGAEFINHGYKIHSIREGNSYQSTFDYNDILLTEVEADIFKGHKTLIEHLGISPRGFRTPHFGNFQNRKQLCQLYNILKTLKYDYSTSTIPYFGLRFGAYFKKSGLIEIPVSGLITEPLRIFDSFLYFNNMSGKLKGSEYKREGLEIAQYYRRNVKYGVINIYADPSQIYNCDEFFQVMEEFADFAESTTYSQLVDEIERK